MAYYDPKTSEESQALKNHPTNPEFPDFALALKNEEDPMFLSYRFSDICKVLTENIASGSFAHKLERLTKITDHKEVYNDILANLNKAKSSDFETPDEELERTWTEQVELENVLREVFDILDDAFFFGCLKDHVRLDIRSVETGQEFEDKEGAIANFDCGYQDPFKKGERSSYKLVPEELHLPFFQRRDLRTAITMFLFHTPIEITDPLAFWIGVIAHESLHAMIGIYSCECWKKCLQETRNPLTGKGWSGHGKNFCEILEGIQKCLSDPKLGLGKMDCGIKDAAAMEMVFSGWIPTDDQCERWGLSDKKKITDMLESDRNKRIGPAISAMHEFTRARIDHWLRSNDKGDANRGMLAGFCSGACIAIKGAKMAYRAYQVGPMI